MLVGKRRCHSASRRALDETLHDEERLVNLLYGAAILAYCRGNGAYAYRTATELVDDGGENLVVNLVQAILIDVERLERHLGNIVSDGSVALYLGEITHSSQQGIGDTRGSARTAGDFHSRLILYRHLQEHRTSLDNLLKRSRVVIFEMQIDSETSTQRSCKQTASRCCSYEGKRIQVYLDAASRRTLVYHDIDAVILHRRIEILLYHRRKSVDFIDKEHIVGLQRGKDSRQIARLIKHRTRCNLESYAQFVGDDVAQRGLTQSRRTMEERMVEWFATIFGSLNKDLEIFHHAILSAEIRKLQRAQRLLEFLFGRRNYFLSYIKIFVHSMTIIDNMGAKLHICCGIKEEKPNYFAHDFAQSQKIRADLQALPYKNVIIYHFLAE